MTILRSQYNHIANVGKYWIITVQLSGCYLLYSFFEFGIFGCFLPCNNFVHHVDSPPEISLAHITPESLSFDTTQLRVSLWEEKVLICCDFASTVVHRNQYQSPFSDFFSMTHGPCDMTNSHEAWAMRCHTTPYAPWVMEQKFPTGHGLHDTFPTTIISP